MDDEDLYKRFLKFGNIPNDFQNRPVLAHETATIAFPEQAKVAALLYDKIWVAPISLQKDFFFDFGQDQPPAEVAFCGEDDVKNLSQVLLANMFKDDPGETTTPVSRYVSALDSVSKKYESVCQFRRTLTCGGDVKQYEDKTPSAAYRVVINNIKLPSNSSLSWKQVLEFRKDVEVRKKLHWMKAWIDKDLSGSSEPNAKEALEDRLDQYYEALKKHGAITKNGMLASVFAGLSSFAMKPDQSGVVIALSLTGGMAIQLQKRRIENRSELLKSPLREMAWMQHIEPRSLFSKLRGWF